MSKFNILAIASVAVIGLSACTSSGDREYLGSRDDIIVNNKNLVKQTEAPAAKEKAKIEMAKEESKTPAQTQAQSAPQSDVQAKLAMTDAERATVEAAEEANNTGSVEKAKVAEGSATPAPTQAAAPAAAPVTAQATAAPVPTGTTDIPPNAKPGECYAKVLVPGVIQKTTGRVKVAEEQKVLNRIIPAQYRIEKERILVKEARQYWKAGQGPITKKDEVTGEIMCLVEEPAQYKIVEKRILVEEEKPEYKMIPAQYETVTKTETIQPERWEWRRILCETNMGTDSIIRIQQALRSKGYNIAVDGRIGDATLSALRNYQAKNGLAASGITYETLEHLGVRLVGA